MDPRQRITQVTGVVGAVQILAMLFTESVWVIILPAALASLPVALLTMRSPETVELMRPNLNRAYAGVALLSCAVVGWFLWSGTDTSFGLKLVRAMLTDLAILWLAMILGVQSGAIRRQRGS